MWRTPAAAAAPSAAPARPVCRTCASPRRSAAGGRPPPPGSRPGGGPGRRASGRPASRPRTGTAPRAAPRPAPASSIACCVERPDRDAATRPGSASCRSRGRRAGAPISTVTNRTPPPGTVRRVPALVLGPLLRYVGETEAVIWVETDAPVRGRGARHARAHLPARRHHYALVRVRRPRARPRVRLRGALDGERVVAARRLGLPAQRLPDAPEGGRARGGLRLLPRGRAPRAALLAAPRTRTTAGREIDALRTLALRMRDEPRERWPDLLLLLGDQVYADEVLTRRRSRSSSAPRPDEPPGRRVLDYEEYTRLYHESWCEPAIRWLLSTVPTAMIFDDHDVHDDWNISQAWVEEMRATDWWDEHIVAALMSYWVYQHIGNLSPRARRPRAAAAGEGARTTAPILREFAARRRPRDRRHPLELLPRPGQHAARGDRLPRGPGARGGPAPMVDADEWEWVERARRPAASTICCWPPRCRSCSRPGCTTLEAWSEAVAGGAWGGALARLGERMRRAVDLEHWAAFQSPSTTGRALSARWPRASAARPPASIVTAVRRRAPRLPVRGGVPTRRRARAAQCGRPCARPTATRWTRRSGG